jgi:glutamyl-tRNA reductase
MDLGNFYLVGVNYKKTDASTRGLFAINTEDNRKLLQAAKQLGIKEVYVVSTCNRTELYAITENLDLLFELISRHSLGSKELLIEKAYVKNGTDAIQHLYEVGAGLDSQILGDYEIVGQLKTAFKIAKEEHAVGPFIERVYNTVLQASKAIKNNTELSSGTISVSFATIQYILSKISEPAAKNILVIGTGKIGVNTCKNIVDYIHPHDLVIMNRTDEKAIELASSINAHYALYENLQSEVNKADIIIVATMSKDFIINANDIEENKERIFIDLSIPNNVNPAIAQMHQQLVVNVDDLSKINDITLEIRRSQVPLALAIIEDHITEFQEWYKLRKYAPVLKSLKHNLSEMQQLAFQAMIEGEELVSKIVNKTASDIRTNQHGPCFYMEAVNEYMEIAKQSLCQTR